MFGRPDDAEASDDDSATSDEVELLSVGSPAANDRGLTTTAQVSELRESASFRVERRSLWPVLGLIGLLAVGLVWSSSRQSSIEPVASQQPPATVTQVAEADEDPLSNEPSIERLGGLSSDDRFYLVPIPTADFTSFEANLLTVGIDEYRGRDVATQMFAGGGASIRLNPGVDRHPLLSTNQGLVIVGLGEIFLQDRNLTEPAEQIGEGISVLAGPNDNSVWILGTAERTVELYDLSRRRSITVYRLEDKGRPLASVDSGIILANRQASPANDFLYWEPIHGLLELDGTDNVEFYGANGSTAVFGTEDELLVFDLSGLNMIRRQELVDGKLTGTRVTADVGQLWGSSLSPDGSLLAATIVTPFPEANVIKLIDTETGEVRDTIQRALEFQYRWNGPNTLVYMRPDWPEAVLVERDSETGTDRQLMALSSLAWWYAIDLAGP